MSSSDTGHDSNIESSVFRTVTLAYHKDEESHQSCARGSGVDLLMNEIGSPSASKLPGVYG